MITQATPAATAPASRRVTHAAFRVLQVLLPGTVGVLSVILAWGRRRSTAELVAAVRPSWAVQPV